MTQPVPRPSPGEFPTPVRGNDWSVLKPVPLESWVPTRSTTVVIPAYGSQHTLDLTLASLAAQTHASALMEVVVVDDGSTPPLTLPDLRPENTRLVRASPTGWGRAHACHTGALAADGDVLHWLDADMVVFADHVAAQARWHDLTDHVVTLGYKRFVEPVAMTPQQVYEAVAAGRAEELYDLASSVPHEWVEKVIDDNDGLRLAGSLAFRVHVGATGTVSRELYLDCGGMDTSLKLGEDSELGYRLAQAGAVFVPEPEARSWHLGPSTVMRTVATVSRYNTPFITDRMPVPRFRRRNESGRLWSVPLVDVLVEVGDADYEAVKATVDSVLRSSVPDLVVSLVHEWSNLDDERRSPLGDPDLDRRLVAATYRGDARVRLVDDPPPTSFPAPYRLLLPVGWLLGRGTLDLLIKNADERRLALLLGALRGVSTADGALRLERTASVRRALRLLAARDQDWDQEDLDDMLEEVGGQRWYDVGELGIRLYGRDEVEPERTAGLPTTMAEWKQELLAARADVRRWKADAQRWQEEAKSGSSRSELLAKHVRDRRSPLRRSVRAIARRARRLGSAAVSRVNVA